MDRRVLLVDDDPAMLRLLSKHLTGAGYEVFAAGDGRTALDILHREGPPVVLSDLAMPGMDGLELCQAIRSSEAIGFVYIIILTADREKDRVVEALEAGANDFLAKPFHHQELLARLNAGMRIISLEADLQRQQRELHKANAEMAILNSKLERAATTDDLTGLANRREGMNRLKSEWTSSLQHGHPLSCIMLDIDHFKTCNDSYGHEAGDVVLRQTAEVLDRSVRAGDLVCRIGGEEFLVICPNSNLSTALQTAERLRRIVESNPIGICSMSMRVTISGGAAERCEDTDTPEDLLRHADRALYAAKADGRNQIQCHGAPAIPAKVAGSC